MEVADLNQKISEYIEGHLKDNISTQDVRKGRFGKPALFLLEVRKEGMNLIY
mgnify:CR=1 FL=1